MLIRIVPELLGTQLLKRSQNIITRSFAFHSTYGKQLLCPSAPQNISKALCTSAEPEEKFSSSRLLTNFKLTKQILFRGKAATSYQESIINEFLESHEKATSEEWNKLISNVFGLEFGMINEINVDGKIVDSCARLSKLNLARSYLSYMKSQNKKFNGAVVAAYIKICFTHRKSMTEQDQMRVKQFTNYLRKRYPVADKIICDSIVKGLVLQRSIEDAIAVLKESESLCSIDSSTYSAILIGFLENDQFDTALEFAKSSLNRVSWLETDVYLTWIELYKDDEKKLHSMLKLFLIFDIKPQKSVLQHLANAYKNFPKDLRLVGEFGTINNRGICSVCQHALEPLELKEEEFNNLREVFLNNVIVKEDIFLNSSPQELKEFFTLVKTDGPFDVVIDGLNVAYMTGTKGKFTTYVKLINYVLAHFREQNKKVLLIGRKHMRNWPNLMNILRTLNCTHFFIDDLSEDDPFLLYAAMYSGIDTIFVTRDLFRCEKFLLQSEKEATLFKRWQQAHQIFVTYVAPDGRVYLKNPCNFQMSVQCSKDGDWHIPYLDDGESLKDDYEIYRKWFCLRKIP